MIPLFFRAAITTSGMSRTAATTFSRLTFHDDPTTVMNVITMPSVYATTRLRVVTFGSIWTTSPSSAPMAAAIP